VLQGRNHVQDGYIENVECGLGQESQVGGYLMQRGTVGAVALLGALKIIIGGGEGVTEMRGINKEA
jgi:hypothetical protein